MAELAEKIKTLKAAHSIDATPQRVRQRHSTAEEPITARIRRRAKSTLPSVPALEFDATPEPEPTRPPTSTQNSSIEPPLTFQERIAMKRQRKDPEPSLP